MNPFCRRTAFFVYICRIKNRTWEYESYLSIHFIRTSSGTLLAGLPFFYFFPPLQENNKNQSNFSQSFVYYLVIMVFALFIYRQAIPLSSSVINKVLWIIGKRNLSLYGPDSYFLFLAVLLPSLPLFCGSVLRPVRQRCFHLLLSPHFYPK